MRTRDEIMGMGEETMQDERWNHGDERRNPKIRGEIKRHVTGRRITRHSHPLLLYRAVVLR
eukprot:2546800-Rhodomonas_salina.1